MVQYCSRVFHFFTSGARPLHLHLNLNWQRWINGMLLPARSSRTSKPSNFILFNRGIRSSDELPVSETVVYLMRYLSQQTHS